MTEPVQMWAVYDSDGDICRDFASIDGTHVYVMCIFETEAEAIACKNRLDRFDRKNYPDSFKSNWNAVRRVEVREVESNG